MFFFLGPFGVGGQVQGGGGVLNAIRPVFQKPGLLLHHPGLHLHKPGIFQGGQAQSSPKPLHPFIAQHLGHLQQQQHPGLLGHQQALGGHIQASAAQPVQPAQAGHLGHLGILGHHHGGFAGGGQVLGFQGEGSIGQQQPLGHHHLHGILAGQSQATIAQAQPGTTQPHPVHTIHHTHPLLIHALHKPHSVGRQNLILAAAAAPQPDCPPGEATAVAEMMADTVVVT